ncbi:MAG: diacylglycerol kinase family lipid kinase [Desulfuromonadales bacterium]
MNQSRHIKLIANPVSGGNALRRIYHIRQLMEERGTCVDLFLTEAPGDAEKAAGAARSEGFDRIIAAGGDGTLNEVVNGMAPCEIPLAFIPLGTTNVFALEAGIPFDLERAFDIALQGEARPVCLGRAADRLFLLMAGVGFDAEVVRSVSPALKRRVGKGAYLWSGLKVFAASTTSPIQIELPDGETHTGYSAIVGNGRYYAGRFSLTPGASLFDDGFEVFLLRRPGRLNLLRMIWSMLLRRRPPESLALTLNTRHLRISGDDLPVQLDGDPFTTLPVDFSAEFGKIAMVFPRSEP